MFATPTHRNRTLSRVGLLVVLFAGATLALRVVAPELLDPSALRAFVLGFGSLAPVVFVLLQATQVVVAPIPGQIVGLVGGYLFGPVWGTVYSLLGVALGSTVVFVLSRRYGRPYVERMIVPETVAEFDDLVDSAGLPGLFLVFLIPGLPDDAVCFLAGLTRIPIRRLVAVAVVGRAPGFLLVAVAGADLAAGRATAALWLLGAVSVVSLFSYLYRDRIVAGLRRAEK
nr:TVP38/TMEM64 family protein [Salinirubrum litoreum]